MLILPFAEDDNYIETGRIPSCGVVYLINIVWLIKMSFFQHVCEFKKLYRGKLKLTTKGVHLKCGSGSNIEVNF